MEISRIRLQSPRVVRVNGATTEPLLRPLPLREHEDTSSRMDGLGYRSLRFDVAEPDVVSIYGSNEDGREIKLLTMNSTAWAADRALYARDATRLVGLRALIHRAIVALRTVGASPAAHRQQEGLSILLGQADLRDTSGSEGG